MKFQEKLIQLRKEHKLSQEQLAEKLGVSRQAVSRWEAGETTPDMLNLLGICNVFGVSADYLIRDDDNASGDTFRTAAPVAAQTSLNRTGIFRLISAACFQAGAAAAVVGACHSDGSVQLILSFVCGAICSAAAAYQLVRFGKN